MAWRQRSIGFLCQLCQNDTVVGSPSCSCYSQWMCAFEFHSHARLCVRSFLFTSCEYSSGHIFHSAYLFTSRTRPLSGLLIIFNSDIHIISNARYSCTKRTKKRAKFHQTKIILNFFYDFYVRAPWKEQQKMNRPNELWRRHAKHSVLLLFQLAKSDIEQIDMSIRIILA